LEKCVVDGGARDWYNWGRLQIKACDIWQAQHIIMVGIGAVPILPGGRIQMLWTKKKKK
jgi:hypothetical protein